MIVQQEREVRSFTERKLAFPVRMVVGDEGRKALGSWRLASFLVQRRAQPSTARSCLAIAEHTYRRCYGKSSRADWLPIPCCPHGSVTLSTRATDILDRCLLTSCSSQGRSLRTSARTLQLEKHHGCVFVCQLQRERLSQLPYSDSWAGTSHSLKGPRLASATP